MEPVVLDFKYSFIGDFSEFVSAVHNEEIEGFSIAHSPNGPLQQYENAHWRAIVSRDRIDFFPKQMFGATSAKFIEAFGLFQRYLENHINRLAINSTVVLFAPDATSDHLIFRIRGFDITEKEPAEFNLRINDQTAVDGFKINSIMSVTKSLFNVSGTPKWGVTILFDFNCSYVEDPTVISKSITALTQRISDLFEERKNEHGITSHPR